MNLSHEVTQINDGDRICQMVINKVEQAELIEVDGIGRRRREGEEVSVTRVNNKSFIMTKLGRLLFVFLLLLCTTQLFADKKKVVEPTLEGEAKVQFDYAFMEGVRCKVLGDLKSAIAYFDQCMKIYNKSAAVRYELSSILVLGEDYTLPLH